MTGLSGTFVAFGRGCVWGLGRMLLHNTNDITTIQYKA